MSTFETSAQDLRSGRASSLRLFAPGKEKSNQNGEAGIGAYYRGGQFSIIIHFSFSPLSRGEAIK